MPLSQNEQFWLFLALNSRTISGKWRYINVYSSGAIIGDGDPKSWDPRAPMIWDNFSIFRTNCAILTSYIRADPRICRGLSRGCCHVVWSNGESWETLRDNLAYFSQRWQGIRQGIRTRALIRSFMLWANGKGGFFRVEKQDFNFALGMNNKICSR